VAKPRPDEIPVRRAWVDDAREVARLLDDFNREFGHPTPGVELLAERLFGFEVGPRQWIGVAMTAAGLLLLVFTLPAQSGAHSAYSVAGMVSFEAGMLAIGALLIIERNVMVYRRTWMILFSGFFEPLFYLFFFVYPLQEFIGDVTFEERDHRAATFRRRACVR